VLETAAKADPKNIRWSYALAHTSWLEAESTSGKEAEAKRKQAKEAFGAVVEREPGSTDYQYWYAVTCFEMIDDVGMLSKAGLASTGRKAFEKAIEIDPNNVSARYGLGVFFYKAPGIAGGSNAKAKAQGEALLSVPGGRGEYWGRMLLAQIAIADKNWTEMSKQLTAAETAKGDGANPAAAFQTQIFQLLGAAKNPSAALPVIARYRAAAKPDENAPDYLEGLARSQMGQCETAVVSFEKVLARTADARNTRYELAACYEKLGNRAEAKKNYDEFAKRFPADDRAQKAKDASKRLS
jgi:tetratricopeptide (TPR) repeat protein